MKNCWEIQRGFAAQNNREIEILPQILGGFALH